MAQYSDTPPGATPVSAEYGKASSWVGWIAFAGMLMLMLGVFHIVQGLVAVFNDDYYLVRPSGLIVNIDYTAWGWVQLIGGVVVLAAGFAVFAGQMWARIVGVAVALVSAIINVGFLAAYPLWSLMMIALDVIVIMALTVHGSEIRADHD
jgi:hypothetical protein